MDIRVGICLLREIDGRNRRHLLLHEQQRAPVKGLDHDAVGELLPSQQVEHHRHELLRQEQFSDRVMIQSFDWSTLLLVQKQAPTIPTVYLTQQAEPAANIYRDKPSRWTAGFDPQDHGGSVPRTVKAAGGAIWSPDYRDVDARSISEAHRLGLPVIVWTVNRPQDMAQLIGRGVDGIISDRPDLLRTEAAKKGIPLPAPAPVSP